MENKYFVQIRDAIGELFIHVLSENEIIRRADMHDCSDEEFAIWRTTGFGEIEPLKLLLPWHNPDEPLLIEVVDLSGNVVFSGYGTDH